MKRNQKSIPKPTEPNIEYSREFRKKHKAYDRNRTNTKLLSDTSCECRSYIKCNTKDCPEDCECETFFKEIEKKLLYVKDSSIAGEGLFSSIDIEKDKLISYYDGKKTKYQPLKIKYVARVNNALFIDAENYGIHSKINHSCNPNCRLNIIEVKKNNKEKDFKLAIFANDFISKETELTINYGSDETFKYFECKKYFKCNCNYPKCKYKNASEDPHYYQKWCYVNDLKIKDLKEIIQTIVPSIRDEAFNKQKIDDLKTYLFTKSLRNRNRNEDYNFFEQKIQMYLIGFKNIELERNIGHYSWEGYDENNQDNLKDIKLRHITEQLVYERSPPKLNDLYKNKRTLIDKFNKNKETINEEPNEDYEKFPYDKFQTWSAIIVAKKNHIDLSKIDFIIGGSALYLLALPDFFFKSVNPGNLYIYKLPNTNSIVLSKKGGDTKKSNDTVSNTGFKKLGKVINESENEYTSFEHLEIIRVNKKYSVLIYAEIDAIDDDGLYVRVQDWDGKKVHKKKNDNIDILNLFFQMLSSGSSVMFHGTCLQQDEHRFHTKSLINVYKDIKILKNNWINYIENNIIKNLEKIKALQFNQFKDMYDISYDFKNHKLSYYKKENVSEKELPEEEIINEIIQCKFD